MRNPARNQLPDPIPSLGEFEGIVNTKRIKALGYGGLQIARNVEIDNEKRLLRRDGYSSAAGGTYSGLYGTQNQRKLLVVRGDSLLLIERNLDEVGLASGMLPGIYSWDEDPNNNVYFTSSVGSSGIVMDDASYRPLVLPVPVITGVAAVDARTWAVVPFNLGARYTSAVMHLFATYLHPDGRESAPSDSVTIPVVPGVSLLQMQVSVGGEGVVTYIYATAPGGSTYYLVMSSGYAAYTIPVFSLTRQITGAEYPYTTVLTPFPEECSVLAHYAGRLYASVYDEGARVGVVYCSLPAQYHLFDRTKGFISVSGRPSLLLVCAAGLLIGTDTNIYLWDDKELTMLTEYGVVPGVCGDVLPDGKAFFWTLRGVARAMPYELVTEERFSGDPGVFSHARIFHERGYRKLVACTITGGESFNEWRGR